MRTMAMVEIKTTEADDTSLMTVVPCTRNHYGNNGKKKMVVGGVSDYYSHEDLPISRES